MRTYVFPIGLGHGVFEVVLKANSVFAAECAVRSMYRNAKILSWATR